MEAPEISLQWLRPLVESKTWDYCVVWKLGSDPSRFIELVGCCCSGAYGILGNVKEEDRMEQGLAHLCRDVHIQHRVSTMACQALAAFPHSISLYSGSRGEVVMMNETQWLIHGDPSGSKPSDDFITGTRVLIPVVGGLVELYNSRLIPKDQKTIEFVRNRFKIYVQGGVNGKQSKHLYNTRKEHKDLHEIPNQCPSSCLAPLHLGSHYLSQTPEPYSGPCLQGSSTGSTPATTELTQCDSPFDQSVDLFEKKLNLHFNRFPATMKSNGSSPSCINNDIAKKRQRGQHCAKNLVTERKRRNKIKDGLYALRAIVPKITKMDMASIVGDAINYIMELQESLNELENELNQIDAEDVIQERDKPMTPEKRRSPCNINNKVHVEVNQISTSVFMLRFMGKHCRGQFSRMMEIMDSLGLQVLEANVTTFNGLVLSVFRVEVKDQADGAYDSEKLEYVLVQLTNWEC
ncbi:unnamed protein product [Cuscuta epithymum]|uniref:BHLH domain-containing protein n=1 Tax=Cuscuta epithymum TaxID=186058 RepID=A0AAV0EEG6_9ASTE|nr:unnamed protein product [Cuscuta epithymum]